MVIENFSAFEMQILSLINDNKNTFKEIEENVSFGQKTLLLTLEALESKNILKFNKSKNIYEYDSPIDGEMLILEGNLLLPTTVIKIAEKQIMYVSRGNWYELPIDFDIRRIIWNVKLGDSKNNSTLIDLIKTSILKEKKSKIIQLPEYIQLQNKIVPYSKKIGLLINAVGEDVADVTILFKIKLTDEEISLEHKGFTVRTEISSKELLDELKKSVSERDYSNIKLNHIYNFSDFVFSKNEIPINLINGKLQYLKITAVKKMFELTYYELDKNGLVSKIDIEQYPNPDEAIEKIRDIFSGFATSVLIENNFISELND